MARIVVIGAGVGGLGTALCAARTGHHVTIVERDDTPLPADPHGAFDWDRHGAPQVRHSHAFLARLRNLLRDRHPDVLADLIAAGATEMRFLDMPPEGMAIEPEPGDEDLVGLAVRRTTFEWVLRRAALAEGDVELLHGTAVSALRTTPGATGDEVDRSGPPLVVGVEVDDGRVLDADVVVAAGGRRSDVPALLEPHGVTVDEVSEDTGIIYLSRFFRLQDGAEMPPLTGPIGGDLGYIKYGVFPGDNRTFSITFAVGTHDAEMRKLLLDDETFLAAAGIFTATAAYVEPGRSEPINSVQVMGGLINRRRRFLDADGRPVVAGFHAVGDAHTATNPLYGRGCSLAMVQAQVLADLIDEHGVDGPEAHAARSIAYEQATRDEVIPWYKAAVSQDRMARDQAERAAREAEEASTADGPSADADAPEEFADPAEFARTLLRDGLFPALRVDPVVLRAFLRMLNLLDAPDSLMANGDVIGRVMAVFQDKDNRPPEPDLGPDRAGFLAAI
ncbi:FAD-dependent oxidoreductase [Dermatobacter hominis]|uniref:FAD-dependent oxidoreductase n=1 Tax=Dermatobacter hominis TaxID=2884263 RepID=UPI001D1144BC|nr:NAD-binding protein [Dermatobacter hominis]UDY34584.1 FAD-dependent oxidoreductase [Dermatobacter hominis]